MAKQAYILPAAEISQQRWNACVQQANNGLIYSYTNYLNAMAPHWHGVVINNYAAVMAIPWKMKWGFRYAYMPAFTQQLGLIGDHDESDLKAVLRTLPDFLSYGDTHFNFSNTAVAAQGAVAKTNLVIDLQQSIDRIRAGYRNDLKENIRKAAANDLIYTPDITVATAVSAYRQHYATRMPHTTEADYQHFQTLCSSLLPEGNCIVRAALSKTGEILAVGLFLKDNKRVYNLMNTTSIAGRALEANHFLLDQVIAEFAGQYLLFDFEGSELPGVKTFYRQFGAVTQPYFHYHHNSLPWWLRLLRR